ncbi:MAG: peptidase, partial [Actinomycetota bacterium]|nr:peptidase [Actinomycetota bacterium]
DDGSAGPGGDEGDEESAAVRLRDEGGGDPGGGSLVGLAGVGATVAALAGGAAVLQRARRRG